MVTMSRFMILVVAVLASVAVSAARAEDAKPMDEGKGSEFKAKKIEMKDKSEAAMVLSFEAAKEFEATTDGTKETDIHLFVYDDAGKEVGKGDTTGPKCSVKVTPAKTGKYKFVVKNVKGGDNTVTFAVTVAK